MGKHRFLPYCLLFITFLLTGEIRSPSISPDLQDQLDHLAGRGITYRFLDAKTIEIKDDLSGEARVTTLTEPRESEIRAWASSRGIPILEIDPNTIDTSQYSGMYTLWTSFPLAGEYRFSMVLSDFDEDDRIEACGLWRSAVFPYDTEARIYSIDSNAQVTSSHTFEPYPGIPWWQGDVDDDSLREVMFVYFGLVRNFKQLTYTSLPTAFNFLHQTYPYLGGSFSGSHVGSLDNDDSTDFLYIGATSDSMEALFVAEYRPDSNNFIRVWENILPSGTEFGGSAVGDFDGDGHSEFVFGEINGQFRVFENTANNRYETIWQDTTPFVNLYYMTQGDVDFDGRQEFFLGANVWGSGLWITVYEADANNQYSAKFIFHLLSGGIGGPTLMSSDMDNDGQLELIIFAGSDLYVFKSSANDEYYLWYYRRAPVGRTVQAYSLFDPLGRKSLVISRDSTDTLGALHIYSEIYRPGPALAVNDRGPYPNRVSLSQNYPNPFNSNTLIEYSVSRLQLIKLTVLNVLGQEVAVLVDEQQSAGHYQALWDASQFPSGIYFYRLQAGSNIVARKMVHCK